MQDAKAVAEARLTHKDLILAKLKAAGGRGCLSAELAEITWRFSARIFDLKADGHQIETQEQPGSRLVRFIFRGFVEPGQIDLFQGSAK